MSLGKLVSCTPINVLQTTSAQASMISFSQQRLGWVVTGAGAGAPKYLGCFRDTSNRALPGGGLYGGTLTVARCQLAAYLGQYKYFGLQVGVECWLGNDLTVATHYGPATNCDFVCAGNGSTLCGGAWANSMYQVAGDMPGGCPNSHATSRWHAASAHTATCMAQRLLHPQGCCR